MWVLLRGELRSLIYLVDEAVRARVEAQLGGRPSNVEILSWQQLGGLQIALAGAVKAEGRIRAFIAGAIQYQYTSRGIRPSQLAAPFLTDEPSVADLGALPDGEKQKMASHYETSWRLPLM